MMPGFLFAPYIAQIIRRNERIRQQEAKNKKVISSFDGDYIHAPPSGYGKPYPLPKTKLFV